MYIRNGTIRFKPVRVGFPGSAILARVIRNTLVRYRTVLLTYNFSNAIDYLFCIYCLIPITNSYKSVRSICSWNKNISQFDLETHGQGDGGLIYQIQHAVMMTPSNGNNFARYWPFVREIYRSPVNSPHKGQWCGALMLSSICAWINGSVNNGEAGDLRRNHAHYNVTVIYLNDEYYPGSWLRDIGSDHFSLIDL